MGDAMNKLFISQQQSALQNQQTGTTAAANMGNVAQQGITNAMNVGQEQMVAPFTTQANMGNILASINAPSTVNTTQTPSLLQSVTGLGTATAGGLNALFAKGTPGSSGYVPGVLDNISKLGEYFKGFPTLNPTPNSVSNPEALAPSNLPSGAQAEYDSSGSYIGYTTSDGQFVDMAG